MKSILLVLALTASLARADQWVTPTAKTLTSPNKKLKAKLEPAADAKSSAKVTIGTKTFALAAKWMPVDAVLFDDGTLLTLDNWHQLGHGDVATLYERDGKVRWKKTLVELIGQAAVDGVQHSVSSIWWRKTPLEWTLAKDGKSGLITLADENKLRLTLRDGSTKLEAVANLPDDPPRLLNRARSLANQSGQEVAAIAVLDRIIAKEPEHYEALLLFVELMQRTNQHARAVAMLERVSPTWKTKDGYGLANVCVAWGKSYVALSRPADAERVLRRGIDATPEYTNPAIALAELLYDEGRRKDGDIVLGEFVDRLLKASYLDQYALSSVAEFYKKRKDYPKALALYLKGYKKDQVTNQFLYASLAQLYEEMGNDADAIRIHEQLLAYFQKMGSAFDMYTKQTRDEITRLRAKKGPARHP